MTGQRRLSQAISEGDGISLIVPIDTAEHAREAEDAGAEALLVLGDVRGIREATTLPLLTMSGDGEADACVLSVENLSDDELERRYAGLLARGLECAVEVRDDDDLEIVLERLDPEILLLSPRREDQSREAATERVLSVLADLPAGKLAIAHLMVESRNEVAELERAGVDAVTVGTADVAGLAGATPPAV